MVLGARILTKMSPDEELETLMMTESLKNSKSGPEKVRI